MAAPRISDALLQEAIDVIASEGTSAAAARKLGIASATLRSRKMMAAERGLTPGVDPVAARRARAAARRQVADDRAVADRLAEENEALQAQIAALIALRDDRARHEIPTVTSRGGRAIPIYCATDWHVEESVERWQVPGGVNEFNPTIARKRADKFFGSALYMTNVLRHMARVDTACLFLGGDLITGYIHDELVEANHLSPTEAVIFAQSLINSGIEHLLAKGDLRELVVVCSWGNHGRTTQQRRIQTAKENSFEWLMYKTLEREWAKERRVRFHIATQYHNYVRLFDTTVRFHHGDAIGYGGGVGGITIPIRKKIAAWNTVMPADLDVFGHFHQLMDGGDFVVNGSLIGFNAFAAHIGARHEIARQALIWIDKNHGKTLVSPLYVAE